MMLTVNLLDGIKVGDTIHKEVELRPLTVGQVLDAYVAAEKVAITPDGYKLVTNNVEVEFFRVMAAISLKNDPGVKITKDVLRGLTERDYNAIIDGMVDVDRLDIEAAEERGRV